MAAVNDDDTVALYSESIANFGAAYAATQESVKTQGTTIALMQTQLQAMHQYCMGLQQQPPHTIYAPQQQARGGCGYGRRTQATGGRGGGGYKGQRQRYNNQPHPRCHSTALRIGTTATHTVGTSTSPTTVKRAVGQGQTTTIWRQGRTHRAARRRASTR
jgi:hypothetical protein